MSVTSREVHLVSRPEGVPETSNFEVVTTEVEDPADGEVMVRNLYMSVDPAMRPPMTNGQAPLNEALGGGAIGRVIESRNAQLPVGTYVQHRFGFREYFTSTGDGLQKLVLDGEPLTTHFHVLGGTGFAAWGGLLVIGQVKEGENVFVSAAAGSVGSLAAQIAKIKNCRVAGSCGSDEKVAYLRDELHLDYAFNYNDVSIGRELHTGLPEGIDVFFDNVGGKQLDAAVGQMRPLGRVAICGQISGYNNRGARSEGVTTLANTIYNRVTLRGFTVTEFESRREEFLKDMRGWLDSGKLTYRETIVEGIEQAPQAFIGMMQGENLGKMLVRLAPDD